MQEGDEEEELPEGEEQEDGADKVSVSALASSSAAFWQRMIKARWQRLQQEEAEGAAEAAARAADGDDADVSGAHRATICKCLRCVCVALCAFIGLKSATVV